MIFFQPMCYVSDKLHFIPFFSSSFSIDNFVESQKVFSPAKMLSLVALFLMSI